MNFASELFLMSTLVIVGIVVISQLVAAVLNRKTVEETK